MINPFKATWNFLNNKKRIMGGALILVGIAMKPIPGINAFSKDVVDAGISLFAFGYIHHMKKEKDKRN